MNEELGAIIVEKPFPLRDLTKTVFDSLGESEQVIDKA